MFCSQTPDFKLSTNPHGSNRDRVNLSIKFTSNNLLNKFNNCFNCKKITEKCKKHKCSKVLVDVREFTERIYFSEIFDLVSKELPEIIKHRINKVAIVDVKGFNFNKQFFENVAINRGHNVKIFTDINNAI